MISVSNLSFGYGEKPLYEGVSFIVGKGQKVGLVGPNGAGKSTLFKILTGKEDGFTGSVQVQGTIGVVPQEVKYDPDMEVATSAKAYADPNSEYQDHELKKLFKGLELEIDLSTSPKKFSGGQKTKLALARALLSKADILFLDEPTNFMDVAGKRWVMQFLSNYEGCIVAVSHDLKLMDHAIDKVLAVDPATRTIEEYKGNYSSFVRLKKEKDELFRRQLIVKQKHIKQMEEGLKKMARFTSKKGVRARVRQQRRVEKEKQALPEAPSELRVMKISLPEPAKVGELPIMAKNISKSYGDLNVISNMSFVIERGQRIAIIGPNGTGKSTFIKILMGMVPPDNGDVAVHEQTKIGYYSQEFETFDFSKTVFDTFTDAVKKDERFTRSFLGRFMLSGDKAFQKVETLSGGEKTRLSIAILTAQDNNVLILDEPTTYLDVLSQRIILESLKEYKGTMLVVSHTPEFIQELSPQKALLFPEQKTVFWSDDILDRVEEV